MIIRTLNGWAVDVVPGKVPVLENGQPVMEGGVPKLEDAWTLLLTETNPPTGDQIRYSFGEEVKEHLVKRLTGGVVIAHNPLQRL